MSVNWLFYYTSTNIVYTSDNETSSKIKSGFAGQNILSDLPPIPNSSGEIVESVRFQYSHDVVEVTGSKQVTKSHDIIRGARLKETEAFGKANTVLNCQNNGTSSSVSSCNVNREYHLFNFEFLLTFSEK